jgi:TIR domain-containing protein
MGAGEEWSDAIEEGLRDCRAVVVLLSGAPVGSDMVRREVELAHKGKKRILPVRVDFDGEPTHAEPGHPEFVQFKKVDAVVTPAGNAAGN